jgi:hypothetical protein
MHDIAAQRLSKFKSVMQSHERAEKVAHPPGSKTRIVQIPIETPQKIYLSPEGQKVRDPGR